MSFVFPQCSSLPAPVMMVQGVSFKYPGENSPWIYNNLEFGMDLDTRVALVGPNGAGKSTLLKVYFSLTPKISSLVFPSAYIQRIDADRRDDSSTQSLENRALPSTLDRPT